RTYPAGAFAVFLRAAGNTGGKDMARLLRVTSGVGTSTQTTTPLGQFDVPNTSGWQNWAWAPLVDSSGNAVTITNSGSVSTYQLYEDNGGWNGNFFMLAPPDTSRPRFSNFYPNGLAMFQRTNTLSFAVSSLAGINANSVVVTLNGVVASNLVFGGSATNLTVMYPNLQPDTAYTASIVVNTANND